MGTIMSTSGYKGTKPPGWFSRRHPTNAEHVEAQQRWRDERSPEARRRRAMERTAK